MLSALSFTSPLILIALISLPALWLLLRATPPSPKRTGFPAFMILQRLISKEETPDKTPWPLLLLRLLIAGLIIIALAGPVLNAPPPAAQTGPLVLVVDNSWAAADHWRTRQNAIEQAAAEAASTNRPLFIMQTVPHKHEPVIGPLTQEQAQRLLPNLTPAPLGSDPSFALSALETLDDKLQGLSSPEIRWLSDGIAQEEDQAFTDALMKRGTLKAYEDKDAIKLMLVRTEAPTASPDQSLPHFEIKRLSPDSQWEGNVSVIATDGRELANIPVIIENGLRNTRFPLDLPLALRNEASLIRIENISSAGAVHLVDARDRRALIGFLDRGDDQSRNNLLSGAHYVRQALAPYAAFMTSTLDTLIEANASVIVLDDVGLLRAEAIVRLEKWVESGGVLVRFAGPTLAEASQDGDLPLMSTPLHGGGRAFGGALTWDTPQPLDKFNADGPFSVLTVPDDVFVRQQVLARPGGETTMNTWAQLQDGTPLVTGRNKGAGVIALFHVTATPQWSDLPVSGIFVQMLRRLTFLSAIGPDQAEENESTRYAPLRLLEGTGSLRRAEDDDPSLDYATLSARASLEAHPGFYGAPDASYALNAVHPHDAFEPRALNGISPSPYEATPPSALFPPIFTSALILLLIDGLVSLWLAGKLTGFRKAIAAIGLIFFSSMLIPSPPAQAQAPLSAELEDQAVEAALTTRLAYVKTGDPAVDRLSQQGLTTLTRELTRRTAIEPADPVGIILGQDDLSIYPFLYWPVLAETNVPSEAALDAAENFMRFGGMIVFDTRDDERSVGPGSTQEGQALQSILSQLDIPPLKEVDASHVLCRSFYLLSDLVGRSNAGPVWVQQAETGSNDGVTPLIIGGRDWAAAWAADNFGRPLRPMRRGGPRAREFSYRAGVNMVMVAFTGNYKSDQVHTPILLERLGQ